MPLVDTDRRGTSVQVGEALWTSGGTTWTWWWRRGERNRGTAADLNPWADAPHSAHFWFQVYTACRMTSFAAPAVTITTSRRWRNITPGNPDRSASQHATEIHLFLPAQKTCGRSSFLSADQSLHKSADACTPKKKKKKKIYLTNPIQHNTWQ